MLGIIGGMGPHAGLNLLNSILDSTKVEKDQDHLPAILWSTPHRIPDRSSYLIGKTFENPAQAVAEIAKEMQGIGVTVVGIPCNTFHAPAIWNPFQKIINELLSADFKILNMIERTAMEIERSNADLSIGIIGTMGTFDQNIYGEALSKIKVKTIVPDLEGKNNIHQSIYDKSFGIKANGGITEKASQIIKTVVKKLSEQGANAILLGCTEFSIISKETFQNDLVIIDPSQVLGNSMIETYKKLIS